MKKLVAAVIVTVFILSSCSSENKMNEETYSLRDDTYDAVAAVMLADIYSDASLDSERITQALYGQPLKILGSQDGFYHVALSGDIEGYVSGNKISMDVSSLKTNERDQKILVTGESKTIYSRPDGEVPVVKVTAGTVLSFRDKQGDWIRVGLADGTDGYLTLNNIILYERQIPKTDTESFCRDIQMFSDAKFLTGGISMAEGFDMPNLVRLCALLNGIEIPLDLKDMMYAGKAITDGDIQKGDILFLSKDRYNETVVTVAVILDAGVGVFFSDALHSITAGMMIDEDIRNRTRKVIRLFGEQE
jgi:gamma-D-glutamyl-L-lysine dipeptidyl-peptidase